MAAALTVEEVADALATCDICQELYNEDSRAPLLLEPCRHVFCRSCITKLVKDGSIRCPKCRQDVRLGEFGVAGLAKDFVTMNNVDFVSTKKKMMSSGISCTDCPDGAVATHRCQSCRTYMCTTCHDAHYRTARTRSHRVVELRVFMESVESFLQEDDPCPRHGDKQAEFYCKKCETSFCVACTVVEHRNHEVVHLEGVFQEHLEESKKLRAQMDARKALLPAEKENRSQLLHDCLAAAETVKKEIESMVSKIRSNLDKRAKKLVRSCDQEVARYKTEVADSVQALSMLESSLEDTAKYLQEAEQKTRPSEFIGLQKRQAQSAREVLSTPQVPIPAPSNLQLSTVGLSTVEKAISRLGKVRGSSTPSTCESLSEKLTKELLQQLYPSVKMYDSPETGKVHDCQLQSDRVLVFRQFEKSGNGDFPLCIHCPSFDLSEEKLNTRLCKMSDPSTMERLAEGVSYADEDGTHFANYPGTIGSITLSPRSSNYFECHLEIKPLKKVTDTKTCAEIALAAADSRDNFTSMCRRRGWGVNVSTCKTHQGKFCVQGRSQSRHLQDCPVVNIPDHGILNPAVIKMGFLLTRGKLLVFDVGNLSRLCTISNVYREVVPWFSLRHSSLFETRMCVKTGDSLQMDAAKICMLVKEQMELSEKSMGFDDILGTDNDSTSSDDML